jgi:LCP family protein required for cell wall assembly
MADRAAWDPSAPPPSRSRRSVDPDQARRMRPDGRPSDLRRVVAAALSSVLPGAGQALNGRLRAALFFGVPTALILVTAWFVAHSDRPTMLAARLIAPPVLTALLVLNVAIFAWRALAVVQAFTDRRYPGRPGRVGVVGLVALLAFTVVPHAIAWNAGTAAQASFAQVFEESTTRSNADAPLPGEDARLNVLLIGIDSGPGRTEALTDSMIVVSLDPVGRTVSMVSIPRDLAGVPLGNGDTFGPKINSLMSFADRHKDQFPDGGVAALEHAVSALFGIPIHAYATVNLRGFVAMVDAVGGVDVDVRKPLADPNYGGFGVGPGWSIEPGEHHLDGANALAYARIRKSTGESDFTRAARQQQVLVALRDRAVSGGALLSLPKLLAAVGSTVRTDLPQDRLPQLAALAEQIDDDSTVKVVLTAPQIKSGGVTQYGSVYLPVPTRIAALTKVVFGPPGADPTWPIAKTGSAGGAAPSAGTVTP